MSKTSAQAIASKAPGLTRSSATLLARQHTLGPHVCVQREAVGPAVHPAAPSLVRGVVDSPGAPLDAATRSDMEPRFGYDFSQVRVHSDDQAAESARAVNANAYTAGNHVAFGAGTYAPGTPSGQRLMAHELTHVVQQASGPVEGTPAGEGLSISHPADRFERNAATNATKLSANRENVAEPIPQRAQPGNANGAIQIQRDAPPDVGDTPSGRANAAAADRSATAAQVSAGTGVFSALIGAYAAIRAANFAGRSAEAAEDPPTAEPTSGGITVTDADIPEIKGLDLNADDKDPESTTETKEKEIETPGVDVETTSGKGPTAKKTTTKKPGKTTTKESTSKVFKPVDKPDRLDTWKLLNINQGPADSVDFSVSIRSSGKDIKDGGTEPPDSTGYLGGSSHANASAIFKAKPGPHDTEGTASVRLFVGGTNTPPRKFLQSSGFLGGGGPVANEKYSVQRFGGAITFYAPGEKKTAEGKAPEPKAPVIEPRLLKPGIGTPGDGKTQPLVTISMLRSTNTTKGGLFQKDDDPTSPQ